jgi:hypothetical protein
MAKVIKIQKARERKRQKPETAVHHESFQPCSPDMTICGDCTDNRAKKKCPRLKEWLIKRSS